MQIININNEVINVSIDGITSDSRQVGSNYLFAALPGDKEDGSKYILDAISHGASVVLISEVVEVPTEQDGVVFIRVKNVRQVFAKAVADFYQLQPQNIVAVTGTSGKTSTVSFVQQLWHLSGITKCASLGTLGLRGPGMMRYGSLTTPDAAKIHAELADLSAVGINHLAMEASSHGLDQYRLDGVKISAAAYTNLSRDHLDYHNSMDDYFDVKSRLFSEVMPSGNVAVINTDDEYSSKLLEVCQKAGQRVITVGKKGEDIQLLNCQPSYNGQDINFRAFGKEYQLTLPLVGDFQVMNALCALGLVLALDKDPNKYAPLLAQLRGVAGRLQLVNGHPRGAVYIDYAHKPGALEAVLKTLRPHTSGQLVCVFGCGGNRDPGKREMMGKIASDLADKVIVTDDNPRYENPAEIRKQIMEATPEGIEIGDRAEAIRCAVEGLSEGDVLVVAGKGHERGQIIGDSVLSFDDFEEVKKVIGEIKG